MAYAPLLVVLEFQQSLNALYSIFVAYHQQEGRFESHYVMKGKAHQYYIKSWTFLQLFVDQWQQSAFS